MLLLSVPGLAQAQFDYTINSGTVTISKYTGPGGDVIIPESINGFLVTAIGDYSFYGCIELTSVTIPNSVTSIGYCAFQRCSSLASVTMGKNVVSLGWSAFSGCTSLLSVAIPDSVTSLGRLAFVDCNSLTVVTIGKGVTSIREYTFNGCNLTYIDIPDSVTNIGVGAFSGCKLASIDIPDNVTSIGAGAFSGCNLTSVDIPDSVTAIGANAFWSCTNLTSATIGSGVTIIGSGTFQRCISLGAVYFRCDAPDLGPSYGGEIPRISPFIGTSATIYYLPGTKGWGAEHWGRPAFPWSLIPGDVDGDEDVDRDDLNLIVAARNTAAFGPQDRRDLDGDGMITVLDARILVTLFSVPGGFTRVEPGPQGIALEWTGGSPEVRLQSTFDLRTGNWEDVEGLQSSTNAVITNSAERMFFRLVLPE